MSTPSERLKSKWDLLKGLDQKHEISRLRLRADVAECINDCYKSGMTRVDVARLLEVTPARVTRLVQGNLRADPATIRRNPENYRLTYIEIEPEIMYIDRPVDTMGRPIDEWNSPPKQPEKRECYYCGKFADYKIEWEDKKILVCKGHKPAGSTD